MVEYAASSWYMLARLERLGAFAMAYDPRSAQRRYLLFCNARV
ncbi:hypothetical protein U5A82_04095 [Sphingobium sp. CR2-8]|nr:hypothetical protein [Sphingobium sp. CR2-8]MEC3909673.1 hypothetical protein [Sphingobium sp. CR2-8]